MSPFIFLFSILAAAQIATGQIPYEDDARYYEHHHASQMTAVTMPLFVRRQSLTLVLDPRTPCQALRKMRAVAEPDTFQYMVYYTLPGAPRNIIGFTTVLTTSIGWPHPFDSVVTYQTTQADCNGTQVIDTNSSRAKDFTQEATWFLRAF